VKADNSTADDGQTNSKTSECNDNHCSHCNQTEHKQSNVINKTK